MFLDQWENELEKLEKFRLGPEGENDIGPLLRVLRWHEHVLPHITESAPDNLEKAVDSLDLEGRQRVTGLGRDRIDVTDASEDKEGDSTSDPGDGDFDSASDFEPDSEESSEESNDNNENRDGDEDNDDGSSSLSEDDNNRPGSYKRAGEEVPWGTRKRVREERLKKMKQQAAEANVTASATLPEEISLPKVRALRLFIALCRTRKQERHWTSTWLRRLIVGYLLNIKEESER